MPIVSSLAHRGGLAEDPWTLWPSRTLFERVGGRAVLDAIIEDLYHRIEHDDLLSRYFPHFQTRAIKSFFAAALGGKDPYRGTRGLAGFHRGTLVTPSLAARWLSHMKASLENAPIDSEVARDILEWLRPIAGKLAHEGDEVLDGEAFEGAKLVRSCEGVRTERHASRDGIRGEASRGRLAKVKEALEGDPGLLAYRDRHGRSLLWEAAGKVRQKVVAWLLEQGADADLPGCEPSVFNLACSGEARLGTAVHVTPWALSLARGHDAVAALLESHGAKHDIFGASYLGQHRAVAAFLAEHPDAVHHEDPAEDFKRVTPLHHAIAGGQLETARLLIEGGARVQPHSEWLLSHAALQNRADLVELLLDHGADVHETQVLGPLDEEERPVADLLVSRGFDIDRDSSYGAMLVRACRGDVSARESTRVATLLGYGADVNRDHHGLTALHYAVRTGRLPLIRLLLDHGADVHRRDREGLTPLLHLAKTRVKMDPLPVLELLREHGAAIDACNDKEESLLFHYARRGESKLVEWLLENGADPDRRNRSGKSLDDTLKRKSGKGVEGVRKILQRRERGAGR